MYDYETKREILDDNDLLIIELMDGLIQRLFIHDTILLFIFH